MRETLKAEYRAILEDYLGDGGEAAVLRAYDFARKCLRNGLAPDDVMEFHVDLVEPSTGAHNLLLEVIMAFSLGYRQTMEELERTNQELAQVSRFKSRMLSMVAHDLTNHITAVKIFANGIAKGVEEPRLAKFAANILEVVKDQETLIQNLLDIGRIESGRLHLSMAPQPLRTMIEGAVARHAHSATGHTFEVAGDEVEVLADRAKLQQILDNLIGNAVKYSPQGGPIEVSICGNGGQVGVEVRDHGMGIAAGDLPHIFEPFFRGSVTAAIKGTGLGLSIVKSLVMLQGGSIGIDSQQGEGTTIRFTLPRSS